MDDNMWEDRELPKKPRNVFLRFLLQILLILLMAGATLVIVGELHTNGDRRTCYHNLSTVWEKIQAYEKNFGHLPLPVGTEVQGTSPCSWRVALCTLPDSKSDFGISTPLGYKLTEPWDGPNNSKLHVHDMWWLHCDADPGPKTDTSYVAVVGSNTAFNGTNRLKLSDIKGEVNTAILFETHNSGIHWMEPRDWTIDEAVAKVNSYGKKFLDGHHGKWLRLGSPNALYADGSIRPMNPNIDSKILRELLDITDETKLKDTVMYPEIQQPR